MRSVGEIAYEILETPEKVRAIMSLMSVPGDRVEVPVHEGPTYDARDAASGAPAPMRGRILTFVAVKHEGGGVLPEFESSRAMR